MGSLLVSVVVAMRNAESTIVESLESVINSKNSSFDFEIIVVDDQSTDLSVELCKSVANDANLTLIPLSKQVGQSEARNIAISKSKGAYILVLDSDDILIDGALDLIVETIKENPNHNLIFGNRIDFGPWGQDFSQMFRSMSFAKIKENVTHGKNPITHSGTIFKRAWFEKIGGYNDIHDHAEDYGLWFKGIMLGPFYCLDLPIVYYRNNSRIRNYQYWSKMEVARRRIYENALHRSPSSTLLRILFLKYLTISWIRLVRNDFGRK